MTLLLGFIILLLLIGIGFLSASETAITAASKPKLHHMAKRGDKNALNIRFLQQTPGLTLSALLMCATFFMTFATSLMTEVVDRVFQDGRGVIYAPLIIGGLIVIYAETLPKIIAVNQPERVAIFLAKPMGLICKIFRPLTVAINYIARITLQLFRFQVRVSSASHATLEELRGVIDLHHGPGQDVPHERAMLKSILDLGSVQVGEIMIHRKNVTMVDAEDPPEAIVEQVLACPFTRVPLFKDDPDNVIGVINAKALLRAVQAQDGKVNQLDITTIASPPWFVPESTDLLEQLQAFRKRREHFALVVDEYGSIMGIVTLEDILEEIVGDISDEHDVTVRGVRAQEDGSYIVDGSVTIRDLNRQFEWDLPDEEAATIAGLVLYEVRLIPEVGQAFMLAGFKFEILRRHRNQITLLRITPPLRG
ncbi:MAG: CNNM domain-containing protein [Alphaproteobacteria bacterium]|jgi:Mg2+/Co2+ transporter CorB|nr:CNNM domain-containing protein [Alphaproteobacteria bacterium]